MTNLVVHGNIPISGTMTPSGSKNAVLPMLCATLLTDEKVTLTNVPDIGDVDKIISYFTLCGSQIDYDKMKQTLSIQHRLNRSQKELHLPTGIRSSILLLAPILVKNGSLSFNIDVRGCALGIREIDPHIDIIKKFGGTVESIHPYQFKLNHLIPQDIWAEYASVTATETFAMIASVTSGKSRLINAASEPHVQALCYMLQEMGAKINGIGTSTLEIEGKDQLSGGVYRIPDDHHEVATFLAIGAVTSGRLTVKTTAVSDMTLILRQFSKLGMQFQVTDNEITVTGCTRKIEQPYTQEMMPKIEAAPWPYFPADLLPQAIGIAVGCEGEIVFWNKVYEGALAWSSELSKFGARTHLSDPHRLVVLGGTPLRPATVEAPYIIRVVLGLFLTALQAKGTSIIKNADPIKRAHPNFVEKLNALGAQVEWRS